QRPTVQVLHHDIADIALDAVIVDADDVTVFELGGRLRLADEARLQFRPAHAQINDLDGDFAVQTFVVSAVHRPHAARADQLAELIFAECRSGQVCVHKDSINDE